MGKYERGWAERAEKEIANGLMSADDAPVHIKKIVREIHRYIEKIYDGNKIVKAQWSGGKAYADEGDVHLFLDNDIKVPVELKFSKQTGSGTKANKSTNVLKEYINKNIVSYPEFDQNMGLRQKRYDLVENYIGRSLHNATDYENNLREIKKHDKYFIDKISAAATPGQEAYAKYAAHEMNKNIAHVKKLSENLILGTKKYTSESLVYVLVRNFNRHNQDIEFLDFSNLELDVAKVVSVGKSIKIQNANGNTILRMSVHWKNICQGGATPCFNIFI